MRNGEWVKLWLELGSFCFTIFHNLTITSIISVGVVLITFDEPVMQTEIGRCTTDSAALHLC